MQFWSPKRYSLALRGWFGVLYFIFTSLWFFFQFCMQLQRAPDDTLWCWEVDWRGLFPPSEKDQSALRFKIKMAPAWKSSCTIWTTELHNSFHPTIRDGSTWSKFGARGEHGDVFLFSNLGTLWLGKPSREKSAVFLNIVQKAFDPPLLFEHLSYFAGGVF